MQKRELLEYLRQVKELEDDVYTMDEAIARLNESKKQQAYPRTPSKPWKETVRSDHLAAIIAGCILGFFLPIPFVKWWAILVSPFCSGLLGVLFEVWAEAADKNAAEKEYEEKMEQYRRECEEERLRSERENAEISAYNRGIDEETKRIEKTKTQTMEVLNKLYGVGIVYIKYRGIIPVTMFCEYLESGRSESLEGPNGMYNLYESELRMNLIIGELQKVRNVLGHISAQIGSVSAELSKIRDNQYLLCRSLEEGNRIAQRICTSALAAERNSAAALKNSEWAAYNSEITARNTKAIARVAEFEHMQKYVLVP